MPTPVVKHSSIGPNAAENRSVRHVHPTREQAQAQTPRYLMGGTPYEQPAPNTAQLNDQQSDFQQTVSDGIAQMPELDSGPASTSSRTEPGVEGEETDTSEQTCSQAQEDTDQQDDGGQDAQAYEEDMEDEASSEEDREEESASGEIGEEEVAHRESGEDERVVTAAGSAAEETGVQRLRQGSGHVAIALTPRSRIITPWVPSPPAPAVERRKQIIKKTGSPPELHHAQIRQAVQRVADSARTVQRQMVRKVGALAGDTRISIEDMAREVLGATNAAVNHINRAVDTAAADIQAAADKEKAHIERYGIQTGENVQANRDAMAIQIFKGLQEGSDHIEEANGIIQERFAIHAAIAAGRIRTIPETGKAQLLPVPPAPKGSASTNETPERKNNTQSKTTSPDGPGDRYKVIQDAKNQLTTFMNEQAEMTSEGLPNLTAYKLTRSEPVMQGMTDNKQKDLVKNAVESADRLHSPATQAQFAMLALSLTSPVSQHHSEDQGASVDENQRRADEQLTETRIAVRNAKNIVQNKSDRAAEYCRRDLRDTLTKNIRKSGHKAYKGLFKQGEAVKEALDNSVLPMAEAYRDLVDRLSALLPTDRFLDKGPLLPKIMAARDSAQNLLIQHETAAQQQSGDTLDKMQEVKQKQISSISDAGRKSAASVQDVVVRCRFDFAMFSSQMTNHLSDGAQSGMQAAQAFADRMAEGIIQARERMDGEALPQVDTIAAGFLNSSITGAQQAQYQALAGLVNFLERTGKQGMLTNPMADVQSDLERRASDIDNAMPGQSMATAGILAVTPGLGLVGAGVYLYCNDADEDVVIEKLGNLIWPGILGLEDVFDHLYSANGTLRNRIEEEMGSPEKSHARRLFSKSAAVRASARLDIAEYSTGWFDYNRQARESALQGMSTAERATLSPAQIRATRDELVDGLNDHQSEIAVAYLEGNRERAVAARTREALDNARDQGTWGWIFSAESAQRRSDEARVQAMAEMDGMLRAELAIESAYVTDTAVAASTQRIFREFAAITDPSRRRADQFTDEEAQSAVISYATQGHYTAVLGSGMLLGVAAAASGPLGAVAAPALGAASSIQRVEMSDEAGRFISDLVKHGPNSPEARDSRAVYEFRRAEGESMFGLGLIGDLSETSQTRLSDAFENPELARLQRAYEEAGNPLERSRALRELEAERGRHRQRLQAMAGRLGASEDVCADPARAEQWMARRVGSLFAREDDLTTTVSHARYGREMITRGRAGLVAGVALATDGAGTHESLLRRAYQDRSRTEIEAANKQWAAERGGKDMEVMLGIKERRWDVSDYALFAASPAGWFASRGAETSGDLAMELERLALGNRETDLDHVRYAGLHYNQERVRGTGFLADVSMQGTPEQCNLDRRRDRMAQVILDAAGRHNPEAVRAYSGNPGAIFLPDGSIDPAIQAAAFENGNFRGNSALLQHYTQSVSLSADAYRSEIDRQESMLTTGITVLALVASIALMCIPGVNVVAAGVISAVIAGAATIIVKAGMRGERYGWEEAAVDLTSTGIEAATAGFGGAIAGGLGRAGGLARIGTALTNRLGKVGGAVVRESLVSAISSGAQVAMQDDVWKDGLGTGLERVLSGSLKGAAVAAVTSGISEGLTNRLNRSMSPGDIDPGDFNRMQRLGRTLGPHGSEVFREGVSELMGSVAGETVGVLTDYATGKFKGNFGDALKRIGQAGLRDMATGTMRGGVMSMNRARYRSLLDTARNGGTLGPKDLRALRLAAISAGAMNYDDGPARIQSEIDTGKRLLSQLPPGLRAEAAHLDVDALEQILRKLDSGDLDLDTGRAEFLRDLGESIPDLDPRALMREMENAIQNRRPSGAVDEIPDTAQQRQVRRQLAAGMDESLRSVINDVRIEGLEHLHGNDLRTAAEMIARGEFHSATADAMLHRARQDNPDLNEYTFLRNLYGAVEISKQAMQIERMVRANRHREVMSAVPDEGRKIFADLPEASITRIKELLDQGSMGSRHEQEALFRTALKRNPDLTSEQFQRLLASAVEMAGTRRAAAREEARRKREKQMLNIPEAQRSILSALPNDALIDLRIRQLEGEPLSPAERRGLIDAALRETPDVDIQRLSEALDIAVAAPPRQAEGEHQAMLRRELEAGVPADQRHLLGEVPILIMRDSEFEAFSHSRKGQAVTLILHGRPVVVMREGADPGVLREEGIHAMQSKDPKWRDHIGALDEAKLSQWDKLPLSEQMVLYRNKVALEIDAQHRLTASLEADLARTADPVEQARLRTRLELAQTSMRNLENRAREAGGVGNLQLRAIHAGMMPRPDWLDQPARLFSKKSDEPVSAEIRKQEVAQFRRRVNDDPDLHPEIKACLSKLDATQLEGIRNSFNAIKAIDQYLREKGDAYRSETLGTQIETIVHLMGMETQLHLQVRTAKRFLSFLDKVQTDLSKKNPALAEELLGLEPYQLHVVIPEIDQIMTKIDSDRINRAKRDEMSKKRSLEEDEIITNSAEIFVKSLLRIEMPLAEPHAHTPSVVRVEDIFDFIGRDILMGPDFSRFKDELAGIVPESQRQNVVEKLDQWLAAAKRGDEGEIDALLTREALIDLLHPSLTMPLDTLQASPGLRQFFDEAYPTLKKVVAGSEGKKVSQGGRSKSWVQGLISIAVQRIRSQGDGWLELRSLHDKLIGGIKKSKIENLLAGAGGIIAMTQRGKLSMGRQTGDITLVKSIKRFGARLIGVDIAGQESIGLGTKIEDLFSVAKAISEHNFEAMGQWLRKTIGDSSFETTAFGKDFNDFIRGNEQTLNHLRAIIGEQNFNNLGNPPDILKLLTLRENWGNIVNTLDPVNHGNQDRYKQLEKDFLSGIKKLSRRETSLANQIEQTNTKTRQLELNKIIDILSRIETIDDVQKILKPQGWENFPKTLQKAIFDYAESVISQRNIQADYESVRSDLVASLRPIGRLRALDAFLRDTLIKMGIETQEFMLPHIKPQQEGQNGTQMGLIGLTVHAGEQVAAYPLNRLLDDVEIVLAAGVDRIGHGVVLGLRLDPDSRTNTLRQLGFELQSNGDWFRGSDGTRYRPSDLDALEARRLKLIKKARDRGVTIEVPPTSNELLNKLGVGGHPVRRLMADAEPPPPLRIAVATDNPGIHVINMRSEMASLMALGVKWHEVVRITLEGYAGRLGSRPIKGSLDQDDQNDIRNRMVSGIVKNTPDVNDRIMVLQELASRYPEVSAQLFTNRIIPYNIENDAEFGRWVRAYVLAAMGAPLPEPQNAAPISTEGK